MTDHNDIMRMRSDPDLRAAASAYIEAMDAANAEWCAEWLKRGVAELPMTEKTAEAFKRLDALRAALAGQETP